MVLLLHDDVWDEDEDLVRLLLVVLDTNGSPKLDTMNKKAIARLL